MNNLKLSSRAEGISESSSIKLATTILSLKKQGKNIIGLNVGEPDFLPEKAVFDATKKALDEGKVRYSKVQGEEELVNNIIESINGKGHLNVSAENILVSNGSKQSLYQVFQTICNPSDEVIIFSPYWVTFPESIKLSGATPVVIKCGKDLIPNLEQIKKNITKKTKAIVINSPNNPSGEVYPKELFKNIISLCIENDIYLISDEAYIDLVFEGEKPNYLFHDYPEAFENIITTRTFSKTYSLTGFRTGFTVASSKIISHLNKLQGHVTGNNCTFSQYGASAALKIDEEVIHHKIDSFKERRDIAFQIINPVLPLTKPRGAFYLFPSIEEYLLPQESCLDFCDKILLEKNVAILPGSAFGHPGHIRIAFTASLEEVKIGCQRIVEFIKERQG